MIKRSRLAKTKTRFINEKGARFYEFMVNQALNRGYLVRLLNDARVFECVDGNTVAVNKPAVIIYSISFTESRLSKNNDTANAIITRIYDYIIPKRFYAKAVTSNTYCSDNMLWTAAIHVLHYFRKNRIAGYEQLYNEIFASAKLYDNQYQ